MSKLRVAVTTADTQAVGYYRVRRTAQILQEQGEVEVDFLETFGIIFHGLGPQDPKKCVIGVEPLEADILVLQRPTNRYYADAIPFWQRNGVAVVVDLDDDLEHTADKHAQRTVYDPRFNPHENWQHLKRACLAADLVVLSTPALKRYAPHGRYVVLRNYVPESYLDIPRADDLLTVGWGGTVLNHPGDLLVTYGGVARAIRETSGARFLVVGDGAHVRDQLNLDIEPESTGLISIVDYPRQVARFTVGIAPLERSKFNEAKTALKLLEYSALGVPWVGSSNTSEYRFFQQLGFQGFLVPDRGRSWRRAVSDYLGAPSLREEHAAHNRELISLHHTLERNAFLHAEAWQSAAGNLRVRKVADG